METTSLLSRFLLSLLLSAVVSACATVSPALNAWEGTGTDDTSACEAPEADRCVVLACDDGECGIFDCADVDPEALARGPLEPSVELARGFRPPFRSPGTSRN
ncbi:MAG TPA: DUF2380 domain-containing protein [Myxococcaceae bacterium]|jgi:hypothetical protein